MCLGFPAPPRLTFLVHGEGPALAASRQRMDRLGWRCEVPQHLQTFELSR